ncbi:F-box only protein 21-like [Arctopsyche grandis]|uniref:F-box only protein 21-like n=1 Tax=Arctopsyche grandis TaxID=121162 RepID=UPI00406D7048
MSSASPCGILSLPPELISAVLRQPQLSCRDALSLTHTCTLLRQAAIDSAVWMYKICQQWPDMLQFKKSNLDWFEEYKNINKTHRFCKQKLVSMPETYYWSRVSLSDCHLKEFLDMSQMYDGRGYHYLLIFLKDICSLNFDIKDTSPITELYNMTTQYYATIILDYLNQHYLKKDWTNLWENKKNLTPEKVAIFFDQWMEPKYGKFDVQFNAKISSIVDNIVSSLPPGHPLHSIKIEVRERWSEELLTENHFDGYNCKLLIAFACNILVNKEKLIEVADPVSNTLILRNVVEQKKSNKFFSAIILEAVLRRCGIRCDIVYFPNHRLLLWRENWTKKSPSYLVNPYTGDMKSSSRKCPFARPTENDVEPEFYFYSPLHLLLNLTTFMRDVSEFKKKSFKNAVELLMFLEPEDAVHVFLLGEVYLDLKKDTRSIERSLMPIMRRQTLSVHQLERAEHVLSRIREANNDILQSLTEKKEIKRRKSSVKFAVGMVCYHKMYGYLCVLRGWDSTCLATNEWKVNMGVHHLHFGDKQPFYHVLAIDYTDRYVAEENLVCVNPSQRLEYIEEKLAIDFSHFNGYFYIPNDEKEEEYPEDGSVRAAYRAIWR